MSIKIAKLARPTASKYELSVRGTPSYCIRVFERLVASCTPAPACLSSATISRVVASAMRLERNARTSVDAMMPE